MRRIIRLIALSAAIGLAAPSAVSAQAAARCDKSFAEVFREVAPSVVLIVSAVIDPFSVADKVQLNVASGVVFDDRGHIVTNAHAVYGSSEILVSVGDKDLRPAEIVGANPATDLAVLRPSAPGSPLQGAKAGNSDTLAVGDEVIAVGFPYGIGKTARRGIVSGLHRVLRLTPMSWQTPYIQTDAAISPGNSGGPLVDRCGEVVGLNTLFQEQGQNLNFAIPVNQVAALAGQIIAQGRVVRPWHGIYGQMVPFEFTMTLGIPPGFMVETIEPGSPAEAIGLRGGTLPVQIGFRQFLLGGDVILAVNGEALDSMDTVLRIVRSFKVGDRVTLDYAHEGKKMSAEVTLPERPILPGDVRRLREMRGLH